MTKRREPLTYQRTLTAVAALIGWDRCAAVVGKGERAVRNWSDPECETEIRMIDAERLDRAYLEYGGDHAPFHRLFALRLEIAEREAGQVASLSRIAAQSARETGEAVSALIVASSSSTPRDLRAAEQEIAEAIDVLTDGLATINRIKQGDQA